MNCILSERGSALLLAMIVVLMLAAAAAAAALTARMESMLSLGFKQSQEALFAAEGALARAIQDLSPLTDWTPVLSGASSTFMAGAPTGPKQLPGGDAVVLCCGGGSVSDEVQLRAHAGATHGANTPQWRLYAWGPVSTWLAAGSYNPFYIAVWVADDVEDDDGNPSIDTNGMIVVHAIALGPNRARRAIQATIRHALLSNGTPTAGVTVVSSRESR
jgi:hypothetical protein